MENPGINTGEELPSPLLCLALLGPVEQYAADQFDDHHDAEQFGRRDLMPGDDYHFQLRYAARRLP